MTFTRKLTTVALVTLFACSRAHGAPSAQYAPDAAGSDRIVTVGGAITETAFALGAGNHIVGVDTSSLYPEVATTLAHVGYQRTLSAEGVLALAPTLVLASSEAGPPSAIEQIRSAGVRVETVSAAPSITAARARIVDIASILGRDSSRTVAAFDAELAQAQHFVSTVAVRPNVLALYARGANTVLVFGRDTSAAAMIDLAGGANAVTAFEGSRPLTSEAVVEASPDVILLPSRGLDSLGGIDGLLGLPGIRQTPAGTARRIITVDDLLLLGFGPRTGAAVLELAEKLHPERDATAGLR
jgi:iron complex transport system substrate-binding protein